MLFLSNIIFMKNDFKMTQTLTIYLIGLPGTGKYTIARELAKFGYKIADNQLVNNPIFELVGYDGTKEGIVTERAWSAIGQIRNIIFDFIKDDKVSNYVLTNALSDEPGDHELFKQVMDLAHFRNSIFIPVKLVLSEEENARRIVTEDRKKRFKQVVPIENYNTAKLITINHPNLLELDISNMRAEDVAGVILERSRVIY